jgi:hypothetical protein
VLVPSSTGSQPSCGGSSSPYSIFHNRTQVLSAPFSHAPLVQSGLDQARSASSGILMLESEEGGKLYLLVTVGFCNDFSCC